MTVGTDYRSAHDQCIGTVGALWRKCRVCLQGASSREVTETGEHTQKKLGLGLEQAMQTVCKLTGRGRVQEQQDDPRQQQSGAVAQGPSVHDGTLRSTNNGNGQSPAARGAESCVPSASFDPPRVAVAAPIPATLRAGPHTHRGTRSSESARCHSHANLTSRPRRCRRSAASTLERPAFVFLR